MYDYRDNLEWLARATNWAKLTATASLGVIHRGHEQEALALMQSYLPKEAGPSSGFSEGGGLYALGLIHANHGAVINEYLLGQLKDAQNEVCFFSDSRVNSMESMSNFQKNRDLNKLKKNQLTCVKMLNHRFLTFYDCHFSILNNYFCGSPKGLILNK